MNTLPRIIWNFEGEHRFLSNFWPCDVTYQDMVYPSTEAAYQAAKTNSLSLREPFTKMSPTEAKKAGKKLYLRTDWEQVKYSVMWSLISTKFRDKELYERLLATGSAYLIEGNWWHDNYWGFCFCKKCILRPKMNCLGEQLMRWRDYV